MVRIAVVVVVVVAAGFDLNEIEVVCVNFGGKRKKKWF